MRGRAGAEMGNLTKPVFEEWNFYLVPQHDSKEHC